MGRQGEKRQLHRKTDKALCGAYADQRGFSLLEVLLAMIILAIIALPICRVYISAARTNAKSRKQASATAVAENTMEGINAFSYEDIVRQFDPAQTPNADFLICRIPTDTEDKDSSDPVRALYSGDVSAGGPLVYTMQGVEEDVYTFDVRVTIDPTPYDGVTESGEKRINEYELASVTSYNADKDYLFVEGENALRQACVDHGYSYDDVADQLRREMVVTVEAVDDDADGVRDYVTVGMMIHYEIVGTGTTWTDTSYGARQYSTDELLRNCYLCYLPNYAADTGARSGYDTITIRNEDNVPFDLFLIKQNSNVDSDLEVHEDHYTPQVDLYEGQWAAAGQGSYLTLHANYKTNLERAKDDDETNDGISGGGPVYHYFYRTVENVSADVSGGYDAVSGVLDVTDSAVDTYQGNRMFRVTVEIYEQGACDENFSGATASRVTVLSNE